MSKTIDWHVTTELGVLEVMYYKNWVFSLVELDLGNEDHDYRIYVWNPNLYFNADAESPEDFKSIEDAKAWVTGFINENF